LCREIASRKKIKKVLAGYWVICTVSPPFAGLDAVDKTRRFNRGRQTEFLLITGSKKISEIFGKFLDEAPQD
jgi:hypothetical protein